MKVKMIENNEEMGVVINMLNTNPPSGGFYILF